MGKILVAILVGICLPFIAGYIFLVSGGMPIATEGGPMPMEKFIVHTAMHAALKGQESVTSPIPADETNLIDGAHTYSEHCSVCHGIPNTATGPIAAGMFPPPPQFFDGKRHGITHDPIGVTFWIIKHGIRQTGMPSFSPHLSDTQIWQVSQLLLNSKQLSDNVTKELVVSDHKQN